MIEIKKDSYWEDDELPVDVGILKGIGYEDIQTQGIEYLWVGAFNFSDVPQHFEFQAILNTVSIYLGEVNPSDPSTYILIFNMLMDLISGSSSETYDFASFAPPYTVNLELDKDALNTNADDDDSIESLTFLLGYDKLQRVGETHRVVDRTYILANVTPAAGMNVIPKQFHVKLHGYKNPLSNDTNYDAVEWYSRRPVNVSAIYSEGKLSDTFIVVDVKHMPSGRLSDEIIPDEKDHTSLRVTLDNLTTETENYTRIHYEATDQIDRMELVGFEYDHGYEHGNQYNATTAVIRDIPAEIKVQGNFILTDAKDPFTVFDNASLTFLNGLVDNAMLALASSLYAIGIKLRSIPDALSDGVGTEGKIEVIMNDRNGIQDYLGMVELGVAYGYVSVDPINYARYAASSIEHHDYLMTYTDTGEYSGVDEKVAIGVRFSGMGNVVFNGIEDEKGELVDINVEVKTANTFDDKKIGSPLFAYDDIYGNMPKFEVFYLVGEGDDFTGKDYARIAISNLPDHVKIRLQENITTFDASDSRDGNQIINYVAYESLIDGQYMEFNVTHIPEYLRFINNDTILSVSSIQFPEDATPAEMAKSKYYTKEEDHLNLEYFISNETRDGKMVKRSMPSNYAIIYKNLDLETLNGSLGVASVSGRFNGLKSLYYTSDESNNEILVEIRIENPDEENLAVRLMDETEYNGDSSGGIRGSAIIGPIPEYMIIRSERPEQRKSIKEPDTENIEGIGDIKILMDSVKEFGRSIVDVLLTTIDDTLVGVGMAESTDFWVEFDLNDPVLGTKTNMDVIAEISRGNVEEMYSNHPEYSEAYWTRGVVMRQEILDKEEERAIFDVKAYLTGLPSRGRLAWMADGDDVRIETEVSDMNLRSDWILIDAKGIGDVDLLLYAQGLVAPMEMSFTYDSTINALENYLDADIHVSVTSAESPHTVADVYLAVWSNATDFTRMQMAVPGAPSEVDLSLKLNNSIAVDYTGSEGIDHLILDVKIGDVEQLEERSYWTHGVVIRNGTDSDDGRILDMKMYMEGIPDRAILNVVQSGDDTHVDISVKDWHPRTDWILIDIMGLSDTDLLAYLNLKGTKALDLNLKLDITAPKDRPQINARARFDANRDLGGLYVNIKLFGIESPVILQLYLPEVARHLKLDLQIQNGITATYVSNKGIDHVMVRLHRNFKGEWYYMTLMLHDVPEYIHATLGQNTDFDPERSVLLQGMPEIRVTCSRDGLDVYFDMDGGVNGAYGHTHLQVGDLTNNTKLLLKEPDVYSIDSPGGVGYAYIVMSDRPIMEIIHLNELYIYAEDVHSVDITVKQLFGLYPVFKLSNSDGGRVHVKINIEALGEDKGIALEAGVLDVKYRTVPFLAPLFVNDISTSLGTDHFIIPEPITTGAATVLAIVRGLGG